MQLLHQAQDNIFLLPIKIKNVILTSINPTIYLALFIEIRLCFHEQDSPKPLQTHFCDFEQPGNLDGASGAPYPRLLHIFQMCGLAPMKYSRSVTIKHCHGKG